MPPIRPIQFSALKALDPLHQQPQRGEDDDRQADIQQVGHGPSSDCHTPDATLLTRMTMQSYLGKMPFSMGPCGIYTGRPGSLTEPTRPDRPARAITKYAHLAYDPAGHPGGARGARGPAGAGRAPGPVPWQLPQYRRRPGPDPGRGGRRRERVPAGRDPGGH